MNLKYIHAKKMKSLYQNKILFTALFFLAITVCHAQKTTFVGYIELLFNETNQSVSNIKIASPEAEDDTDYFGKYELILPASKAPGHKIFLKVKNIPGWMVVNDEKLEQRIPGNGDIGDPIFLCKTKDYDKAVLNVYDKIKDVSEREVRKKEKELTQKIIKSESEVEKNKEEIAKLEAELAQIRSEKYLLKGNNEMLAKETFKADASRGEFSELLVKASEYVNRGSLDSALLTLNEKELKANVDQAKLLNDAGLLKKAIENYQMKARILVSKSNFIEAEKAYLTAFELDTKNVDVLLEIANLRLSSNPNLESNIKLFEEVLKLSHDKSTVALLNMVLHTLYMSYDAKRADLYLAESIKNYRQLSVINPNKYKPFLGLSLIASGGSSVLTKDSDPAVVLKNIDEALVTFKELVPLDDDKYLPYVALVQFMKGSVLAQNLQKTEESMSLINESLSVFDSLYALDKGYGIMASYLNLMKGVFLYDHDFVSKSVDILAKLEPPAFYGITLSDLIISKDSIPYCQTRLNHPIIFSTLFALQFQTLLLLDRDLVLKNKLDDKYFEILKESYKSNQNLYAQNYVVGLNSLVTLEISGGVQIDFVKSYKYSDEAIAVSLDLYKNNTKSMPILNLLAVSYSTDATLCLLNPDKKMKARGKANITKAIDLLNIIKKDFNVYPLMFEEHLEGCKRIKRRL
jgi:tetratricopeptide (TPR) repeat protein